MAPSPVVTASTENKSIFGSLRLGQSTSTPTKGFAFGQKDAPLGISGQSSAVPEKTPSSLFNLPSSGAANFSFNKTPDATAQTTPAATPGFNFGKPSAQAPAQPATESFSFGGAPSDKGAAQSNLGQPKPAGSLFDSASIGKEKSPAPPASSFAFKPAGK